MEQQNAEKELIDALQHAIAKLQNISRLLNFGPPSEKEIKQAYDLAFTGSLQLTINKFNKD